MIFGDYDVDGITSSFSVYKFISYFLGYKNISIRYPNKHLDAMKNEGVQLIITVDNGIASVEEAKYAQEL